MRYRRVDQVQKEVIRDLKQLGFSVFDTSAIGKGFGDIVVGFNGVNFIFELKNTENGLLTEREEAFFEEWKGQINKAHSVKAIVDDMMTYMKGKNLMTSFYQLADLKESLAE